jgi:hypothetical protein
MERECRTEYWTYSNSHQDQRWWHRGLKSAAGRLWGDDDKDYDDYDHNDRPGKALCNVGRPIHNIEMWSSEHHAIPSWSKRETQTT